MPLSPEAWSRQVHERQVLDSALPPHPNPVLISFDLNWSLVSICVDTEMQTLCSLNNSQPFNLLSPNACGLCICWVGHLHLNVWVSVCLKNTGLRVPLESNIWIINHWGHAHSWFFTQIFDTVWRQCFPDGASGKELGDVRDTGLISRSGRSPGGGNGNPLQYSCHAQRSLAGYNPQGHKESDMTEAT